MNIDKHKKINMNCTEINWDTENGIPDFFGTRFTLLWNNPSLLNIFNPLVKEIGKDLFSLLVADSSSKDSSQYHNNILSSFSTSFKDAFIKWAEFVEAAGWGRFELLDLDFNNHKVKVRVHNPWELNMQSSLRKKDRWGCPFLKGKLIGIFSNAFETNCWADEVYEDEKEDSFVEFNIYASKTTLDKELKSLKRIEKNNEISKLKTAVKLQTTKIKNHREMHEIVFKNAVDGMLIIENGVFIECNQSALDMLGFTKEKQIVGKRLEEISPEYQPDGQLSKDKAELLLSDLSKKLNNKLEWVYTRVDSCEQWVEVVLTPIHYFDKDIVHVVWRDIHKRKEEQKKLEYLNENLKNEVQTQLENIREKETMLLEQAKLASIGEMIENIAHQWRQPLNNLALVNQDMYVKLLLDKYDIDSFEKSQTLINENIQYMSKTIDNFRNFFNPNKAKKIFEVGQAIRETIQIIDATFKSNFIQLEIKDKSKNVINNYFGELEQVLIIILQNAKDILVENKIDKPKVVITTKDEKDEIILSIEDNAGGIPKDIMHKIFEPYFTTKFKSKGTGLGLYIAKMIIEKNMGGKLNISNTKKGAKFEISLRK